MNTNEDSSDYDHLEHLGLNQKPDEGHDYIDTYTECNNSYDTYSHTQRGQYFHMNLGQSDATYKHARNIQYDDHSRLPNHDRKEQSSDYDYAHAQKGSVTEGDYDHAGFIKRNDKDTYE